MRLYLSSFRLGNRPQELVDLAPADKRALVIANACDLLSEDERRPRVERELADLRGLGFQAEELDLRRYFGPGADRAGLEARLDAGGLVWARGGNSFVLRRAMRQSGFDALLTERLSRDALVYGGYSGGVAVLAPSLRGIESVNDPAAVPGGYASQPIWEGLGLIPYALAPHYRSRHPASEGMETVIRYFIDHHMPFLALRDGEVLVVSGGRMETVG